LRRYGAFSYDARGTAADTDEVMTGARCAASQWIAVDALPAASSDENDDEDEDW